MSSYWATVKAYCDENLAPLVPPLLVGALPWTGSPSDSHRIDGQTDIEPFPPLPSEVVLRILDFALPPLSYSRARERARRLKDFALLSKDCARWATLLVRRDVTCSTADSAKKLSDWTTYRSVGPPLVETARYGSVGEQDMANRDMWERDEAVSAVCRAAHHYRKLRELWLSGISHVELAVLRYTRGPLNSLYLNELRLFPLPPDDRGPPVLAHLTTLHLSAVIAAGPSLSQLLSPDTLPALRHLDFISVHRSLLPAGERQRAAMHQNNPAVPATGGTGLASMSASLAALLGPSQPPSLPPASGPPSPHPILALAPQLHSLSLGPHATRTIPPSLYPSLLSLSSCLTLLSLPLSAFLSADFPRRSLPSPLLLLRLTCDPTKTPASTLSPHELFSLEREWRSSAFAFGPGSPSVEDDVPVEQRFEDEHARRRAWERQRREDEVRLGRDKGVSELAEVVARRDSTGARRERTRYLVLPGGSGADEGDSYAGTGARLREVVSLSEGGGGGGEVLVFSEDPAKERRDGAFRLGTDRWRRFVERPCPDSLL